MDAKVEKKGPYLDEGQLPNGRQEGLLLVIALTAKVHYLQEAQTSAATVTPLSSCTAFTCIPGLVIECPHAW